jgi:hypothetical protein
MRYKFFISDDSDDVGSLVEDSVSKKCAVSSFRAEVMSWDLKELCVCMHVHVCVCVCMSVWGSRRAKFNLYLIHPDWPLFTKFPHTTTHTHTRARARARVYNPSDPHLITSAWTIKTLCFSEMLASTNQSTCLLNPKEHN